MRFALARFRRGLRQRGGRLRLGLRLAMMCLATTAVVLVWEFSEQAVDRSVAPVSPKMDVPVQPQQKFADRTTISILSEALERPGGDVSHLSPYELSPPYQSIDGTTLLRGDQKIRFDGVEGPRSTDVCIDEQDRRWACGLQARAALHNLLASRVLICKPRRALGNGDIAASCEIKRSSSDDTAEDVATALVAAGWARPVANASRQLTDALEAARSQKAGLWRGDWTSSPRSDQKRE